MQRDKAPAGLDSCGPKLALFLASLRIDVTLKLCLDVGSEIAPGCSSHKTSTQCERCISCCLSCGSAARLPGDRTLVTATLSFWLNDLDPAEMETIVCELS